MTLKEAETLFAELDKNSHFGDPEDLDFEAMTAAVNSLVRKMESFFNCRLMVHGPMEHQDSGCFSEICIPREFSQFKTYPGEEVRLSLSRFGKLATISMQYSIDSSLIESIERFCSETGWNYIDIDLLRDEYCPDDNSGDPITWGERFFAHY